MLFRERLIRSLITSQSYSQLKEWIRSLDPKSEDVVEKVELELEKIRLGGAIEEGVKNVMDLVVLWSNNFKEAQEQTFLETNFLIDKKQQNEKISENEESLHSMTHAEGEEDEITKLILSTRKKDHPRNQIDKDFIENFDHDNEDLF